MIARIQSRAVTGVEPVPIAVEVQVRSGPERFTLIGLGDSAVRESRERISSALSRSGFEVPGQVLVNLAPADLKKEGTAFDLPIALGILVASRQLPPQCVADAVVLGELSLDGAVRPVRGVLPRVNESFSECVATVLVPAANLQEAALVAGRRVFGVISLSDLVGRLRRGESPGLEPSPDAHDTIASHDTERFTLDQVHGQTMAKRALIVAAAGGHNLLMVGPPGCGKSMLAARLPELLPALAEDEAREVIAVHSVAGLPLEGLIRGRRPYRQPHHTVSDAGLIGGGSLPRPGEISLAHRGVLFLDELPEFRRTALEALRAPLEIGRVTVSRSQGNLTFPARFQLVSAMNPCPCGRLGQSLKPCCCPRTAVHAYLRKLSQPILDRIDLQVSFDAVPLETLGRARSEDSTDEHRSAKGAIFSAHQIQRARQRRANSQLTLEHPTMARALSMKAKGLLRQSAEKLNLTARGYVRVLRVARTVADLEQRDEISESHLAEALSYRALLNIERYLRAA